jgi:hypothetical protein
MIDRSIQLPVGDTILGAWARLSGSKSQFWLALSIFFIVAIAFNVAQYYTEENHIVLYVLVSIVSTFVSYFLHLGLVYMGITRAKDQPIHWSQLFYAFDLELVLYLIGLYVMYVLALILPIAIGVGTGIGLGYAAQHIDTAAQVVVVIAGINIIAASIVATIYIAVRLSLGMAFILENRIGPITALKQSIKATDGNFWNVFSMFFCQWNILLISIIPVGLGMIWTLPFNFICYGLAFKVLRGNVTNG